MLDLLVHVIAGVIKSKRMAGEFAKDYYSSLSTLAVSLSNHSISKEEFIRLAIDILDAAAQDIYEEAAGTTYTLEDDDYTLIGQWRDNQIEPLVNLAYAIETEGLTPDIKQRLRLWGSSLSSLGAVGYMQSHRSREAEWRTSAMSTEKCETCLALDGHVHRLGWYLDNGYIPGQPGSATLICGGWGCKCGLFDTSTNRRILPLVRQWNT